MPSTGAACSSGPSWPWPSAPPAPLDPAGPGPLRRLIAYRALATYRGEGHLAAWLSRIATRQAIRRLGQWREAAPLDSIVETAIPGAADVDPLGQLLSAERERTVREAVARLPEPYREVVALRFFSELSLLEIAGVTERPLGTVKTHLRRGLERLRAFLAREAAA